jgi:hypothetical protein
MSFIQFTVIEYLFRILTLYLDVMSHYTIIFLAIKKACINNHYKKFFK